jgi:CheY-like chemotaxis protein
MSTDAKRIMIAYADRGRVFELGQQCRSLGLEVVGVHNADTALWFLKNERPDLVCMDAEMETADGLSLCEKIAADGELAFVPIVIMQDGSGRQAMRYPSLCTHFVDRADDLWGQLQPLLVDLLQLEPGEPSLAEPVETVEPTEPVEPTELIDQNTLSTLSQSLRRLDDALEHLEQAMGRSSADIVHPSAECVDAAFEQLAVSDEPAEAAAGIRRSITRRDDASQGTVTFPLAASRPRVFAPTQRP